MESARPTLESPTGGLVERRHEVRSRARQPIVAHVLPVERPVTLQDISPDGFSAVTEVRLTLGATYDVRFAGEPDSLLLRARLAHAMRIKGDRATDYLLGFEFVDPQEDAAMIAGLIARATRDLT
jgi:hypothetical protein